MQLALICEHQNARSGKLFRDRGDVKSRRCRVGDVPFKVRGTKATLGHDLTVAGNQDASHKMIAQRSGQPGDIDCYLRGRIRRQTRGRTAEVIAFEIEVELDSRSPNMEAEREYTVLEKSVG